MSAQQLATLWKSIESAGPLAPAALRFLKTGVDFPTGSVLAGVDATGQRHLCIPAPPTELGRQDRQSRGVTIEVRPLLDDGGRNTPFVDVHCQRPDLNSLFEVVAADILMESQKKPDSPFSAAHAVLDRWRELLEPGDGTHLGPTQLAALLAELLLLEKLGGHGIPPVACWMGPEQGTHDFVCGAFDLEVKSTLTTTGRQLEVHGLSQLMASSGSILHLWWVRLRASPGRGTTVPATVDRLIARGIDAAMFLKKLKLVGYTQDDAVRYRDVAFEIVDSALYVVGDEFPRLTPGSFVGGLPTQVTRVSYTINLDAPWPKPLSTDAENRVFDSVR